MSSAGFLILLVLFTAFFLVLVYQGLANREVRWSQGIAFKRSEKPWHYWLTMLLLVLMAIWLLREIVIELQTIA